MITTATLSLVFDVIVALLLGITIALCWKLNTRIRILRDSKSELAALIAQFDKSTERAKSSILDIQNASKLITESMQAKLEKANYLADDLSFLIEKAGKLAGQLGDARGDARKDAPRQSAAAPKPVTANETLAQRQPAAETPKPAASKPARSRAEQELLDALKSAR